MSRIISKFETNYSALHFAFPYQTQAVEAIKDLPYSAIFHEQGLGKTKIAIDLLLYWLSKRDIDTVLIVTKKQLVKNWLDEFRVHTHIKPKVLTNNKFDNFYVLNSPAKVIVTNFETLSTDKERITLFLKCRNVAIIVDESTKLKNPDAKLTSDFFDLAPLFKIRTIMTGTPVANRPYDMWAQIYFLDSGVSLGTDFNLFKKNHDLKNDFIDDDAKRKNFEDNVSSIFSKIAQFTVRETKASCGIKLPSKEYVTEYCDFEMVQHLMYETVIKELQVEVQKDNKCLLDDDTIALKRLLRLMQITSNPRLIDDSYNNNSGKEELLDGILKEIGERGEKCIIWSSYIDNIEYFYKKYSCLNPAKIHGSLTIDYRNKAVEKFKNDDSCRVLFATPQAAKEGLTLTIANNVVFYDRGFNLDDYLQAQDRIHRISQKKQCFIYNLIVRDSIDEWIDMLLEAKQNAAFLAQGDIDLKQYTRSADYSYGEIVRQILNESKTEE